MEKLYGFEDEDVLYTFDEVLDEIGVEEYSLEGENAVCTSCGVMWREVDGFMDDFGNFYCSEDCVISEFDLIEGEDFGEDDYVERVKEYNSDRL